MAQDRLRMPSSTGGLVNYYDDYKSKIQIKPAHVVLLIVLAVALEIVLRVVM
ncbi:preprotein translocase subunit Sec61beta [Candidatus Pacearchaeota archaeon]|nr:preprotein translocase subunit Sec61beta [Candidatus Pacearchaeota archaeon]